MKLHVQISETVMLIGPHEPEWQAIAALPGYVGTDRQYCLSRTRQGGVRLFMAAGPRWIEVSPEEVTDEELLWLIECAERREARHR